MKSSTFGWLVIFTFIISPPIVLAQESPTPSDREPQPQESIQVNSSSAAPVGGDEYIPIFDDYDEPMPRQCPTCGRTEEQPVEEQESQFGNYISPQ